MCDMWLRFELGRDVISGLNWNIGEKEEARGNFSHSFIQYSVATISEVAVLS